MAKAAFFIFLFYISGIAFSDDITQPAQPKAPEPPARPVVPGAAESGGYPRFPPLPPLPSNNDNRPNEVIEIANYELLVSAAFPQGDTRRNVSNTIEKAQYILYSNNNITLKLSFVNNLQYIYYLENPRSKTELGPGIYRELYDTLVQAGRELLLDRYISEVYKNGEAISSITIIGNNKVIITMNVARKP
ncbi:MAG: hypothetical protein LBQ46_07020 [Treponema sp.]|jgi:hypothetical protein|nr:hypothetical protein [Treponema sp.]